MSDERPIIHDGPKEIKLDNVRTEINFAIEVRLPYAVVGDDAYCVFDNYQCIPQGRVPDMDKYSYLCPNCMNRYAIPGQAFVDWCKFRKRGIVR